MSIPSHADGAGTFFVTSATLNRRRIFQAAANAELFFEVLQHYRREGYYKLHAFVVMPDHIHLVLTPRGAPIERVMGFIKGGFSHRIGSKLPVWQRGFTDHRIRDGEEFQTRREYIRQNPVRATNGSGRRIVFLLIRLSLRAPPPLAQPEPQKQQ
jgi:putative transposase